MNFPARFVRASNTWSMRLAIVAVLAAGPCLAQQPGAAEHNIATPGYLNSNYFAASCDAKDQNAAPQNSPAPGSSSETAIPATPAGGQQEEPPGGKRVFGVLPNYRTASSCEEGEGISARRKMHIAAKDSFDYPLVMLSAAYAGMNQLTNDDPSFGQGVKGYAHRLATNYADQAVGNMLTEGFLPALFHQDPRYFRRGPSHPPLRRALYAVTRVIVTDSDTGHKQFNYSEWIGNASAAALSNIWERDDRDAMANTTKLLEYIGTDAVSQVLK